jgi:hypothetical protein
MVFATRRWLWRRAGYAMPEGWIFVTSAVILTVLGAAIDAA